MSYTAVRRDDMGFVYLAMVALVVGMCIYFWYSEKADIVYYGLKFTHTQLSWLDYPFMPDEIREWKAEATKLAAQPNKVSFDQFLAVMNKTGYLFVWLPVLMAIHGIRLAWRHKAAHTRRRITVQTLPWLMSKHSPAIIPTLYYGDKDTLLLNVDPEEHRSAINPEEWVEQHGLLVNSALDRDKCRELFIAHLGTPFATLEAVPTPQPQPPANEPHEAQAEQAQPNEATPKQAPPKPESSAILNLLTKMQAQEKAMFAVFGTRLFARDTDTEKVSAQDLLDSLNRSCHQGKGYPDLSITDKAFAQYATHPDVSTWLQKHAYPRTLLHAMHKEALLTGKLPSSHFRWLKGMDRGLWYALNTTGRKTPFLESAAVFTQTLWEEFAHEHGYQLTEPYVDDAIDGLQAYLAKIGLLPRSSKGGTT